MINEYWIENHADVIRTTIKDPGMSWKSPAEAVSVPTQIRRGTFWGQIRTRSVKLFEVGQWSPRPWRIIRTRLEKITSRTTYKEWSSDVRVWWVTTPHRRHQVPSGALELGRVPWKAQKTVLMLETWNVPCVTLITSTIESRYNRPRYNGQNLTVYSCGFVEVSSH
jgi:hypothetical protein